MSYSNITISSMQAVTEDPSLCNKKRKYCDYDPNLAPEDLQDTKRIREIEMSEQSDCNSKDEKTPFTSSSNGFTNSPKNGATVPFTKPGSTKKLVIKNLKGAHTVTLQLMQSLFMSENLCLLKCCQNMQLCRR